MLQIRLLGGFEIWLQGEPVRGVGPQLRRLLALLTLEAGRAVETGHLWQAIWPESDSGDVVRQSVRRLREALGTEGHRLTAESGTVRLDLEDADVDISRFAEHIERGDPANLEQAIQLYRGELLRDWEADWIVAAREDYALHYLDALKSLASQAMYQGDNLKAAYYLRRFVSQCPDMEWGWEKLLEAYAVSTSRTLMIETYQEYSRFLLAYNKDSRYKLAPSARIVEIVRESLQQAKARIVTEIHAPVTLASSSAPETPEPEPSCGAVPLHSAYYLERPEDREVYAALTREGSTVLLKGPRQIGKSSLLARALHTARERGACVLLTDWQNLAHEELASVEAFFRALAYNLADQLSLETASEESFQPNRSPAANFERFLRKQVFSAISAPIVWGIDEADRIFPCEFCDDVFGKLRAWHNARALEPDSPWTRFTIVLTYSTEAHLFIKNMDLSPFNVGQRVLLRDMTPQQMTDLNRRHGEPLRSEAEIARLYALLGGHPYLVRLSLYEMQTRGLEIGDIEAQADRNDSIFADHLERMRFALTLDPELVDLTRACLRGQTVLHQEGFVRLCAAGVMTGDSPAEMQPRCRLYERFLRRILL